jgi:hypothetical protein
MSTTMSPEHPRVTKLSRGSGAEDLIVFANAAVVAGTEQTLWMRDEDDDHVLITLGQERITLEFYDVEGAERLYELLGEAVRFLESKRRTVSG